MAVALSRRKRLQFATIESGCRCRCRLPLALPLALPLLLPPSPTAGLWQTEAETEEQRVKLPCFLWLRPVWLAAAAATRPLSHTHTLILPACVCVCLPL